MGERAPAERPARAEGEEKKESHLPSMQTAVSGSSEGDEGKEGGSAENDGRGVAAARESGQAIKGAVRELRLQVNDRVRKKNGKGKGNEGVVVEVSDDGCKVRVKKDDKTLWIMQSADNFEKLGERAPAEGPARAEGEEKKESHLPSRLEVNDRVRERVKGMKAL